MCCFSTMSLDLDSQQQRVLANEKEQSLELIKSILNRDALGSRSGGADKWEAPPPVVEQNPLSPKTKLRQQRVKAFQAHVEKKYKKKQEQAVTSSGGDDNVPPPFF